MVNQIHDELVIHIPGRAKLVPDKCKIVDGVVYESYFEPDEEAQHYASVVAKIMEEEEMKLFEKVGLQEPLRGAVEMEIAPFWAH